MRVKSTWHKNQVKTIDDIAGALAFNSWRITKNQLEDLINEAFVIEKEQVFDVIKEYLCYLIQCVDRLTFDTLDQQKRQELILHLPSNLLIITMKTKVSVLARAITGKNLSKLIMPDHKIIVITNLKMVSQIICSCVISPKKFNKP